MAPGVATGPFGKAESVDELGTLVEELRPRGRELRERRGRAEDSGAVAVLDSERDPVTPFDRVAGDQPQQLAAHRYRRRAPPPARCDVSLEYSPVLGYPAHPQLLDTVITGMFRAGLSLQTAADLPADAVRQRIDAALGDLDDIIRGSQRRIHLPRSPWPAPSCAFRG